MEGTEIITELAGKDLVCKVLAKNTDPQNAVEYFVEVLTDDHPTIEKGSRLFVHENAIKTGL